MKRPASLASVKKVCTKCGKNRSLNDYRAEKRTALGKSSICNVCHADYMKDYMRRYRKAKLRAAAAALRKKKKQKKKR